MNIKNYVLCGIFCFTGCGGTKHINLGHKPSIRATHLLSYIRSNLRRHHALPSLAEKKDEVYVKIVYFGGNFPLKVHDGEQRVFIRFIKEDVVLSLITLNVYSEEDIRSALVNKNAPTVLVNNFVTIY